MLAEMGICPIEIECGEESACRVVADITASLKKLKTGRYNI